MILVWSFESVGTCCDKLVLLSFDDADEMCLFQGAKSDFWAEKDSDEEEEDVDKAIAKEVTQIQERAKSKERRFQAVNSGANNIVFIKTSLPNPNELFERIVSDLHSKKIPKSRYIMRMYPVAGTCKVQTYEKEIEEILRPFFADPVGHSFYLKIKIRNNDGAVRDGIFKTFCYVIKGLNMLNKPNYNEYDYIVIIDVIKTVLCVSVLKDYKLYKEYNLQSLGDSFRPDGETESKDSVGDEGKDTQEGNAEAMEHVAEGGEEGIENKQEIPENREEKSQQMGEEKKEAENIPEVQGNGEQEVESKREETQMGNGDGQALGESKSESGAEKVEDKQESNTKTDDKESQSSANIASAE